jgi:hypothetical protein
LGGSQKIKISIFIPMTIDLEDLFYFLITNCPGLFAPTAIMELVMNFISDGYFSTFQKAQENRFSSQIETINL